MESKIFTQCKVEKHINTFQEKFTDCKSCNKKRSLKSYYQNKDITSSQQKHFSEKKEKFFTKTKKHTYKS